MTQTHNLLRKMVKHTNIQILDQPDGSAIISVKYDDQFKNMLKILKNRQRFTKKLAKDFFQKPLDIMEELFSRQWDGEDNQ